MSLEQRTLDRIEAMLEKADALLQTYKAAPSNFIGFEGWVDTELFAEWRTQSLVVLRQSLGPEHQYTLAFEDSTKKSNVPSSVHRGKGILRAIREDLMNGHLFDARLLIEAEVFTEFLEMAQYLLDQGYKDPAASLAGAVLEDGLRRIATSQGLPFKKSDGIDALNNSIAKAGVYNKLMQSKIDSWRQVRNSADHGKFSEYGEGDVRMLVDGVQDLLAAHLT
jgi:hypothetical protein